MATATLIYFALHFYMQKPIRFVLRFYNSNVLYGTDT